MPEDALDVQPGAPAAADQVAEPQNASIELPFSLEEISDEFNLTGAQAREWLAARQSQMQAGYTRASQSLAEQRQAHQEAVTLAERLSSDTTRPQALRELLNRFGYDLPDDEELGDEQLGRGAETDLEARLAALEAREAAAQQQFDAEMQNEAFQRKVVDDLDAAAQDYGFENALAVPEVVREDVLARAAVLPRLADGGLDFAHAIEGHLAMREYLGASAPAAPGGQTAEERAAYLAGKVGGANPGVVDGGSGDSAPDRSTREARLKLALAVAGRHQ